MKTRDYFAAQAMQAIIAKIPLTIMDTEEDEDISGIFSIVSRGAYAYADAMMEQRNVHSD